VNSRNICDVILSVIFTVLVVVLGSVWFGA
jgi:hypothetical protein